MKFAAGSRETALLERAAELSALEAAFAAVTEGGRLLLVAGEAGVGKTVLLRRFCEAQGARVLWGDCDALFTRSPLGPLTDIAAETGGELADLVEAGAAPHAVAAALLRELTRRDPAIVVLEDVHWADEATLDVLRLVGRRVATVPALVIASYRDDELDRAHPLLVTLGELSRGEATRRLRVAPLSAAAVAELAAPHGVDAAQLYDRTAGNPFFVTEALAAGGVELPATVRDAVLARVAHLSPAARRVLDAAAIVSGAVDLPLLEALAGDAVEHLEDCLSSGVLGPASTGVVFRHELARVAVEESLSPHHRRELHRRALDTLAARGQPTRRFARGEGAEPARLAYHAEGAGDAEAVLRFAPAAAERAAERRSHVLAAEQYARALRFADDAPRAERADLLERRAHQCFLADRSAEAADALRGALDYRRQLADRRAEGDVLRRLSNILWCPGAVVEAERAGHDAVALLEPLGPGRELAMAYANLATMAMNYEDAPAVARWGERALALARELGDAAIEVHVLNSIGTMEFLARGPDARATAERSLERALELGLRDDALRAFANLAWAAIRHREHPLAERYLQAATEYASDPELDLWWIYLLGHRARFELDQGRWEAASETAALVIRERRGSPLPVILALAVKGRLRARRGDPDPWSPLDEALALAGPELQRCEPVAVARAETAWLAGDHARVIEESEDVLALARRRHAGWVTGELARLAPPCRRGRTRRRRARAVRARARGRVRSGRGVLDRARLHLRGRTRARRQRGRGATAQRAGRAARARGHRRGRRRRPAPARARRRQPPARTAAGDAREPGAADRARTGGPRAHRSGSAQPRDRRASVPLDQDGRPPRLGDPAQARRAHPRRGRREDQERRRPIWVILPMWPCGARP